MLIPLHSRGDGADNRGITINVIDAATASIDERISVLVRDQFPDFVGTDHSAFVDFIKSYYEWLEQEQNPLYESRSLIKNHDIDSAIDYFVDSFEKQYMVSIPKTFSSSTTDRATFLKNIKDFYQSKGTETSYKLLFRLLYSESPDVLYPNRDVLKISDAKWREPLVLKVTRTLDDSDLPSLLGKQIDQVNQVNGLTQASGFVDDFQAFNEDGYSVLELSLSNISGTFTPESAVTTTLPSGTIVSEYIYPVLNTIGVSSGASGSGYEVGDQITVSGSSLGVGALAQVNSVGLSGEISTIQILETGINYRSSEDLIASISSVGGTGATLEVFGGGSILKASGSWVGQDGLLSGKNRMQDNDYYQSYSYVIRSSKNLSDYAQIVKRILHPAGFKLFGSALLSEVIANGVTVSPIIRAYETPLTGHYTPYKFTTSRNLRANGVGGSGGTDLYPDGFGWCGGFTGYEANETGSSVHEVDGACGPMGGITHINASRGSGASHGTAGSQGPGGTLNGPQGEQFHVIGSLFGASAMSQGVTGGGHWVIYPHPNSRGIATMPVVRGFTTDSVSVSIASTGSYSVGEFVVQNNPYSQRAIGKIRSIVEIASGIKNIEIDNISGVFLPSNADIIGGSAGELIGESNGTTSSINNVLYNQSESNTADNSFEFITVKDFIFGLDR